MRTAFCSFAVSALLRRAAFLAGFFAAGFLGLGADFTAIAFFVLGRFVATFAAVFFFAFRAMELAALSERAELVGRLLSTPAIGGQLVGDSLVLLEAGEPCALNGAYVDELNFVGDVIEVIPNAYNVLMQCIAEGLASTAHGSANFNIYIQPRYSLM